MANRKISDLTALTAPATGDLLPIVDISEAAAADKNKKITYGELLASAPDGSAAAPSFSFDSDPDSGLYSAGANQVAISTNGTQRLVVDSNGKLSITSATAAVALITGPANAYIDFTDGTGIFRTQLSSNTPVIGAASNHGLIFTTNNTERLRITSTGALNFVGAGTAGSTQAVSFNGSAPVNSLVIDSSGRLLVGTSTARANFNNSTVSAVLQVEGTTTTNRIASIVSSTASGAAGPILIFGKQNSGTVGGNTVVASGDNLGNIQFQGSDGTEFVEAASITAFVDGTPGANDMPGRIVLSTTPDGTATPVERFRITNDGVIAHDQPAPAAVNATATLTIANLKAGIITSTSALATDMTLPTGTDTQAGFSGTYDNFTFEWSVINTGVSLVRVLAGTAHTVVGSGSVATGTSGRFASRRTAANTFVTYRLA